MRRRHVQFDPRRIAAALGTRLRPPVGIVLGSPREVVDLVTVLAMPDIICYQMDVFQSQRLQEEAESMGTLVTVRTMPDLWDLEPSFQTLLYPVAEAGERELKLDMVEQAYHVLKPGATLAVVTPHPKDQLFPAVLKKVFGEFRVPADGGGCVLYARRDGERRRRRHEVAFQIREGDKSLRFLSRPGTFSYGRFDNGARALVETMQIEPGSRILDIGCGCGTNGVIAGLRRGSEGLTVFVDSNLRAVRLAEHNAKENGLTSFKAVASCDVSGFPEKDFDVAIANPPYYAQLSIARLFIERAHALLRKGGRMYVVTKQVSEVGAMIEETFGGGEGVERRGYVVFSATK